MPARNTGRRLAPVHRALCDFESAFRVSRPGNDRSARGPLAALAVTKASKRLRSFYFELDRLTEAMTGNKAHLVVLEELDIAGFDRIFGANDFQVTRRNQFFEDQRAMLKFFDGCLNIGTDTASNHSFVVNVTTLC